MLLYVLKYKHAKNGPEKLGNFNPHAFFLSGINYEDALEGLEISEQVRITA